MIRLFDSLRPTRASSPEKVKRPKSANSGPDSATVAAANLAESSSTTPEISGSLSLIPSPGAQQGPGQPLAEGDQDSATVAFRNPAETPTTIPAGRPPMIPRLFVQSNYVAAVRTSDGAVLSRGGVAMPADVLELYGTGFGPASTSIDAGVDSAGADPWISQVTVNIGGILTDVQFAGRVGPRLYQINVKVPAGLPSGDHPVMASVAGMSTQCEAFLRIGKLSDLPPNSEGRYSSIVRKAVEGD
jgi:hypothetical protein